MLPLAAIFAADIFHAMPDAAAARYVIRAADGAIFDMSAPCWYAASDAFDEFFAMLPAPAPAASMLPPIHVAAIFFAISL